MALAAFGAGDRSACCLARVVMDRPSVVGLGDRLYAQPAWTSIVRAACHQRGVDGPHAALPPSVLCRWRRDDPLIGCPPLRYRLPKDCCSSLWARLAHPTLPDFPHRPGPSPLQSHRHESSLHNRSDCVATAAWRPLPLGDGRMARLPHDIRRPPLAGRASVCVLFGRGWADYRAQTSKPLPASTRSICGSPCRIRLIAKAGCTLVGTGLHAAATPSRRGGRSASFARVASREHCRRDLIVRVPVRLHALLLRRHGHCPGCDGSKSRVLHLPGHYRG
mmetsp:Transcript_33713/g.88659  ORF Transcript_33713/g.88659 Transcript_33713/m.88659 type:complete len:277 (-) Transcript_33713:1501-2331(-)